MGQAEFTGMLIVAIPMLFATITPIIKLNNTITKLNTMLDHTIEDAKNQKSRIDNHSKELDDLTGRVTVIETLSGVGKRKVK